jgi:hypothetical protein
VIEPVSPEYGLKALTLTQPWASLMALRAKRIETRSWYTGYRGELVIHAAKGFPKWAKEACEEPEFARALGGLKAAQLPLSVGVCVVRVVACIRTENILRGEPFVRDGSFSVDELAFGDYSPGRWGWITEFVRPLANIGPVRGELGLWSWADSDQAKAENALARGEAHL